VAESGSTRGLEGEGNPRGHTEGEKRFRSATRNP